MFSKFQSYCHLIRLDKPIGSMLLLWPTLWALYLTAIPTFHLVIVFALGVFVMRSAGCVINDIADRNFDGHVERTKNRPLANGKLNVKEAIVIFIVLIVISLCLLLTLPPLTWLIAVMAFLTTLIYPFMKRFTHLPQVILGITFSWSIPMVYAATIGSFPLSCWLLSLTNICWTIAYDTEYAMVDRDDDLKIGIKSTAVLFGRYDRLIIAFLQLITTLLLIIIGLLNHLTIVYFLSVVIALLLFIYQQKIIVERKKECCFKAFLNNQYVGVIIFIGILFRFA